jgi:hypothetical protein
LVVYLTLGGFARAQKWPEAVTKAEEMITGGTTRGWVLTPIEGTLDRCTNGDVFQFSADHTLIELRCVNGNLRKHQHQWRLEGQDPSNLVLFIDDQRYIVLFREQPGALLMKLRGFSNSKAEPGADQVLRFDTESAQLPTARPLPPRVAEAQPLPPPVASEVTTAAGSATADLNKLPTFFPPKATDRLPLPLQLVGKQVTLQELADRLSEALRDAGYEGKCSYYWLDDQHGPGFAIVTHIEQIQPDGKPVLDQRWGFDLPQYQALTLKTVLKALMHADPGRYRLIALVVSKQPLVEKEAPMTTAQVQKLNAGPNWLGDSPWKTVVTTADFHLIAYVYEFERKSRSDEPTLMTSSNVDAKQHLQSTNLYDDIQKDLSSSR